MKSKTILLYEYSELSPKAKEKAYQTWRQDEDDPFMQSHMINLLTEKLDEHGVKYGKYETGEDPDVRYSLSSCQGDGFMFVGKFEWKGEIVTVTHNHNHYFHMHTAEIETGDLKSEDVDSFKAMYMEVCKEMEREGYHHIEQVESEESFIGQCEGNEWTFREDGTMENVEGYDTKCPICFEGTLEHEVAGTTHLHVCDACPAIVVEWHDSKNTIEFADRLEHPEKYGKL